MDAVEAGTREVASKLLCIIGLNWYYGKMAKNRTTDRTSMQWLDDSKANVCFFGELPAGLPIRRLPFSNTTPNNRGKSLLCLSDIAGKKMNSLAIVDVGIEAL